ncbi:unnamed protein product [Cylicocyclus nassatus]|uniref:Protein kinase domain-containing protein n=1 Tax=Cylicocyclus nassatus TaxID=53992 RepID=A0AA36GFR2_CYLNA|nr:unnamed protein product [Cylicocyclus nassatus]
MHPSRALQFSPFRRSCATRIPRGKVVGKRWRIISKLGEGGFGAVYKVEDINTNQLAALKAEANGERGSVLRLEALILKRLAGKPHVAQLLQSGKKEFYSYIVMTLLGQSLDDILRRIGKVCSVSTQIRIGINLLYGIKQIHDVGFIHRDVKPSNMALGYKYSEQSRIFHIFDFGLAREFVVVEDGRRKMRRPRPGTIRYCSANVQERGEQGRMDDLWCLLYVLVELRGPLPWSRVRDRHKVLRMKKDIELEELLENCPVELIAFGEHISSLNYYLRPDYALLYRLLEQVMRSGKISFSDPYDWEKTKTKEKRSFDTSVSKEATVTPDNTPAQSVEKRTVSLQSPLLTPEQTFQSAEQEVNSPFPAEFFSHDALGF